MKALCIALVLLSLSFLPTSRTACAPFTLGTQNFDICAFSTITPLLSLDTIIDGTITYSLGEPMVPSCNDPLVMVWSTLVDGIGGCYDVAVADPVITLLDPTNAQTGGLRLKYPVNRPTGGSGFELEILLHCGPEQVTMSSKTFSLAKMYGQASTDVTTYTISGSSDHGCATYTVGDCPAQVIGMGFYKLCDLNNTAVLHLTDPLGGTLDFNLGGTPKVLGCSWPHETDLIYGNYNANSGECFAAASTVAPTITPLNYYIPNIGLLLEYHYPYSTMRNLILQIKLRLLCNPTANDPNLIVPTVDVTYTEYYLTFDLIAESSLACPLP